MEAAAAPGAYSTIYDSGRNHPFGSLLSATEDFSFQEQLVRYVRVTDYVIPGTGASPGLLQSVQAFANPTPRVAYFPLSSDGTYFNVNLLRRPASDLQPTASAAYSIGALPDPNPAHVRLREAANVLDGDDSPFSWSATSGTFANATATLTIDLGQDQSVGAVRQYYGYAPLTFGLCVALATISAPRVTSVASATVTATACRAPMCASRSGATRTHTTLVAAQSLTSAGCASAPLNAAISIVATLT